MHGMSVINEYVKKRIAVASIPLVVDFSPQKLERSFKVRFGKIFLIIRCLLQFLSYLIVGRVGSVYMGLSGGNGQIYDIIFAGVSRLFVRNLYLHHHSYQYLNKFRWPAKLLFAIAGEESVHIVACEKMERDLKRLYPVVTKVRVISGIAALQLWNGGLRSRKKIQVVGYLSNISIEKGILEFLDVASWAAQSNLPIQFFIAGPYQDDEIRRLVQGRLAMLSNVTYVGGIYGGDKQRYFDSIDVFLFPTKNESEGLVIHEAMSRGVPVIAYSRGCIEQIITDQVGLQLAPEEDYVAKAVAKIQEWLLNPKEFQLVSQSSLSKFNEYRLLHSKRMDALCAELLGNE
jgi:glycosyltransferase involved in cell wall biosynthesis